MPRDHCSDGSRPGRPDSAWHGHKHLDLWSACGNLRSLAFGTDSQPERKMGALDCRSFADTALRAWSSAHCVARPEETRAKFCGQLRGAVLFSPYLAHK